MKNMGFGKKTAVVGLAFMVLASGAGCTKKLQSETDATSVSAQESVDPLSFAFIDAKTREYTFGLNEFMRVNGAEAKQKMSYGSTLGGVPATCTYTISPNGEYEILQMEKDLGGGTQVDEYFNLGDALFITRSTLYDDGKVDPVDKYYITEGTLYKIDGLAQTVTKLTDLNGPSAEETQANIDIYLSFDEIRNEYA